MASKDQRATYSTVVIKGKKYIKINRRCGFKYDKDAQVSIPYYKDFYGKTKKEADAKCDKYRVLNSLDKNGLPDLTAKKIESRTFRELFDNWLNNVFLLDPEYAQGTKDKYVEAYKANMKDNPIMDRYVVTLIGDDLQAVYNNMTCGASTIKACHKLMRLFFSHLKKQNICDDITTTVKVTQKVPHKRIDQSIEVVSEDEIAKILEGFDKHRLYLLILLAVRTGARISELLALQYNDVTDAGIRINKQVLDRETKKSARDPIAKTKSAASIRIVPISDDTRAIIREHRARHLKEMKENGYSTFYIFTTKNGTLYDRRNVQRACDRVYDKIGVEHLGFHVYRHTFGSMLANNGVPIQTLASLLGHTDISVTARYYINVSNKQKEAAIALLSV